MCTQCLGFSKFFHVYPILLSCLGRSGVIDEGDPGVWDPTLSCHITLHCHLRPLDLALCCRCTEALLCFRHSGNRTCPVPYVYANSSLISSGPTSVPISVLQPRFSLWISILVYYLPLSLPVLDQSFLLRLGQDRNTGGY